MQAPDLDGLVPVLTGLTILSLFGVWKIIELILWIPYHVRIDW